jgi:hypothetical protein
MRRGVAWSTTMIGSQPSMVTICMCLVVLTPATALTAGPTARRTTIASYCSQSGDVCYGILNRGNQVILQITTAARYFTRYTLCVTRLPRGSGPEHARRCGSFPLFRQRGSTWGSSVNFARQFVGPLAHPIEPLPGRYQVSWRQVCSRCTPKARRHSAGGEPFGPSLSFRLPLS